MTLFNDKLDRNNGIVKLRVGPSLTSIRYQRYVRVHVLYT